MKKILLALTLALSAAPALAQDSYNYTITKGANPNGTTYSGTAQWTCHPADDAALYYCDLTWQMGTTSQKGLARFVGYRAGVAYSTDGSTGYGIATYSYSAADGHLHGEWTLAANKGKKPGTEVVSSFSPENVAGTYDVAGTNPDGTAYKGKLTLTAKNGYYEAVWTLGNGSQRGIALYQDGDLVIAYGDKPVYGVALYGETSDGGWAGSWATAGAPKAGTEVLAPKQ